MAIKQLFGLANKRQVIHAISFSTSYELKGRTGCG